MKGPRTPATLGREEIVRTRSASALSAGSLALPSYSPGWSPDGSMIVFTRSSPNGVQENIYTVNADGSGLFQVTNSGGDDNPDWGTHPPVT